MKCRVKVIRAKRPTSRVTENKNRSSIMTSRFEKRERARGSVMSLDASGRKREYSDVPLTSVTGTPRVTKNRRGLSIMTAHFERMSGSRKYDEF
jgi:hypothetical protein